MRCENIILLAFLEGDQDLELIDNVTALQEKYGTPDANGAPKRVLSAMAKTSRGEDIIATLKSNHADDLAHLQASADNGLYLIIHAGATTSNPEPEVLADVTAQLLAMGIRLHKINLAGCFTGGNKLGNVGNSTLAQFGTALVKAVPAPQSPATDPLAGLHVAGYLTQVTTYDANSSYFLGLKKRYEAKGLPVPAFAANEVHNLVENSTGLFATHPPATQQQSDVITQYITALRADALESKPVKALKKAPANFSAEDNKTLLAQMGVSAKKSALKLRAPGQEEQDLIEAYERYMLTKVVSRYEPASRKFVPSTIEDYTDNDLVENLVAQVYALKGKPKFAFNL